MASYKYLALLSVLTLFGCTRDYIDSPLTAGTWHINSVEERDGFKWVGAYDYYPVSTIRFYKDKTLELTYGDGDTTTYYGDWTDYYQDVDCPDNDCFDKHLLVINLYHPSELPTVYDITKLRSNKLNLVSDEPGNEVRFKFVME